MKHWHRCSRWRERFEACPLRLEEAHEDDDLDGEADELFKLEKGGAPVAVRPLPVGPPPVAARVGIPKPDQISVAVPDPIPAGVPVGPPDIVGLPFPQAPGVDAITRVITEAVSQVPARWRPTDAQLANITAQLGMSKQAARADVLAGAAEVEAVSAFSVAAGIGLDDVWPVALIPLLKHLTKARAGARAGVLGRPGPMDPPHATSTFRTGAQQPGLNAPRPGSRGPQQMFRGAMRPPVSFPAMSINMAARMKKLMSLSPRRSVGGTDL